MKMRTRFLQLSAIFPPVLALLVGLSLFFRSRKEDELNRRLWDARAVFSEVLTLGALSHVYMMEGRLETRDQWQFRYVALGRVVRRLELRGAADRRGVAVSMRANYSQIGNIFTRLVKSRRNRDTTTGRAASRTTEIELGLIGELLSRSDAVTADALRLAESCHMGAIAGQQAADAAIIVFSSILAVVMAAGAYRAVKEELVDRKRMGDALRLSDIQLSDASLKLKRASEQLGQHDRLNNLEQVMQAAAHECRNALTPIIAGTDFLSSFVDEGDDGQERSECVAVIERAARRIAKEMERLSRFAQPSTIFDHDSVDLNKTVDEALLSTQAVWKETPSWAQITLEKDLGEVPLLESNEADLCEVVANLVSNAAEAMPGGGTIVVRTRAKGVWIGLEVSDTGVGMTDEVKERCMEPFFSTKGPRASGMGMAVVDAVVRQYRGTMDIESRVGGGTTVVVCFPVEAQTSSPSTSWHDDSTRVRPLHILVVDDESWSRVDLVHNLTADGHRVETASNGHEGLQKFRQGHFDLVVTDRAMPDMGGEELAVAVKAIAPRKAVVLVTGFGERRTEGSVIDAIVSKPVAVGDLRRAIAMATAGRLESDLAKLPAADRRKDRGTGKKAG